MTIDFDEYEDDNTTQRIAQVVRDEFDVDVYEVQQMVNGGFWEVWFEYQNFQDAKKVKENLENAELTQMEADGVPYWLVVK